jgi:hypothetical protein
MKSLSGIALGLLLSAACTMPSRVVRASDTRPSLAISGAPAGSFLFVDGQNAGEANAYQAQPVSGPPHTLLVEAGTHEVELRDARGAVLFHQRVFVESELKTIEVH